MAEIPHGTSSGYSYHRCRCAECTAYNRMNKTRWRKRYPERRDIERAYQRAEGAAFRALAAAHPDEFEKLFDAERVLEGLPPVGATRLGRRPARIDGSGCGPVGSKAPADPHTTTHSPPDA